MTYIKIGDILYSAIINGTLTDRLWDNRESKTIKLEMTYDKASKLFINNISWSIVMKSIKEVEQVQENGTIIVVQEPYEEEFDNSEYCIAGDITDHRNGMLSIKMGKPTNIELLEEENAALLFENLTGEVL